MQPEFEAKNIVLNVGLGARKPLVFVDEVRIAQVFINLLNNAAKFTPEKGSVTLQVPPRTDPATIVVRLTDNGIGMTSERNLSACSRRLRAGRACPMADGSVHRFGGLGLGLAICQRLVDLHGGDITATSAGRGQGSSFTVRLPLSVGADTRLLPGCKSRFPFSRHPGSPATGSVESRILLVEDHEATRKTLEQLLAGRGYRVTTAATLAEARKRADRNEIDLLVSDIGLPDGDGAPVNGRNCATRAAFRGIALTGYGMDEATLPGCRAAGFGAHLDEAGIRIERSSGRCRNRWPPLGHRKGARPQATVLAAAVGDRRPVRTRRS